jgi:hypothetical protein
MKMQADLRVYEVDGKPASVSAAPVTVRSVWNNRQLVEIQYGELRIQVSAAELSKAANKCVGADM